MGDSSGRVKRTGTRTRTHSYALVIGIGIHSICILVTAAGLCGLMVVHEVLMSVLVGKLYGGIIITAASHLSRSYPIWWFTRYSVSISGR